MRIGASNAEARLERGAEVGTHRQLAVSAGERVLNQRLCALRLSYRSLEFHQLAFHEPLPRGLSPTSSRDEYSDLCERQARILEEPDQRYALGTRGTVVPSSIHPPIRRQ